MVAKKPTEIERRWTCGSCKSTGIIWANPLKGVEKCPACDADRKHLNIALIKVGGNFVDIWRRPTSSLAAADRKKPASCARCGHRVLIKPGALWDCPNCTLVNYGEG